MRLRVLVVDDSKLMRRLICDILASDPAIEIAGEAADGMSAIQRIHELRPDVVTLDVEMPGMTGIEVLGYVMSEVPTPIVMLTGLNDPDLAVRALALGAVDFIRKPSGTISVDMFKIKDELLLKVKAAPLANLRELRRSAEEGEPSPREEKAGRSKGKGAKGESPAWVVVVGASTGGPPALERLLAAIPAHLPAGLMVVQHMPAGFTRSLANRLNTRSLLHVVEAEEGSPLLSNWAYVAPGGHHLTLCAGTDSAGPSLHLDDSPPRGTLRPAVDVSMNAAAALFGPRTLGVILTGMGSDGTEGFRAIRQAGGKTIAQDRATSMIYGMPRSVVEQGLADEVLPLDEIAAAIARVVAEE